MASRKEQKEQLKRERQERAQQDAATSKRRRGIGLIAGGVAVAAIVVVVLVVISQGGGGGSDIEAGDKVKKELEGIDMAGLVMGDKNAPVKVVEFADLQCPACKAFTDQTLSDVVKKYVKTGKIQMEIVYLTFIGPDSTTAAKAALAAGEQDRAWHFTELAYENQGAENSGYATDEFLEDIAAEIPDLDVEKWKKDLKSAKHDEKLQDFEKRAQDEGASSTPSFLFLGPNGQEEFTSGVIDIDQFSNFVDPMLKSK